MAASSSRRTIENESGFIVEPRGVHKATIVWLHDLNQECSNSLQFVESLHLENIKWICLKNGAERLKCTLGIGLTPDWGNEDMQHDLHVLGEEAKRVAKILSDEPSSVKKGVGGVGIGGQVALYFATLCAVGHHQIPLDVVIGINGCWPYTWEIIKSTIGSTAGATTRAASGSILLTAGLTDHRFPFISVTKTADSLFKAGFEEVLYRPLPMLSGEFTEDIMNKVKAWLKKKLPLDPKN